MSGGRIHRAAPELIRWALALIVGCGGAAANVSVEPPSDGTVASAGPTLERGPAPPAVNPEPELSTLDAELKRAVGELAKQPGGAPYFLSYQLTDRDGVNVNATLGAVASSTRDHRRHLDVDLRIGDYALDSSHAIRGSRPSGPQHRRYRIGAPIERGDDALRAAAWEQTDVAYKKATERIAQVRAEQAVKADEEDQSDDFSREEAIEHVEPVVALDVSQAAWEARMRKASAIFREYPDVHQSQVSFVANATTRIFVSSEGARVQRSQQHLRISLWAGTTADDGMKLHLHDSFSAFSEAGLPDDATLAAAVHELAKTVVALREAPIAEPYVGPAILEGDAAGVFFHEVFGHRVEGHRQKSEDEGQTFAKKIGKSVMPDFMHVYDDPTARRLDGIDLMGHYAVDDEGVPAQRVGLVEEGVFKTFLMSRAPTRGVTKSNGHGRNQEGNAVVARQGNLIVQPSRVLSPEALKQRLLEEIERAGKPYGLIFRDVQGGYTMTGRHGPQAFKVNPLIVYRIYPDGREELIRGVDLEGTPLTALSTLIAASDDYAVFNGVCGAESGWVPVSAASPSLLAGQIEVARKDKAQEKPPILPPPPMGAQ